MSAKGHSRPSHFVPVLNNVRYASDSDHSRYESELTLWAIFGHLAASLGHRAGVVALTVVALAAVRGNVRTRNAG
jgi:hypothetical protein